MQLLSNVLADVVHEVVMLRRCEVFIDDHDCTVFILLGGTSTDEHPPSITTVRTAVFQEQGWWGVRKGVHGEVHHGR
jgi:hypothetical protein